MNTRTQNFLGMCVLANAACGDSVGVVDTAASTTTAGDGTQLETGEDGDGDGDGDGDTVDPPDCDVVEIVEPLLEEYVRAALGIEQGPISGEALATLKEVWVEDDDLYPYEGPALYSLRGLECAVELERFTWLDQPLEFENFEGLEPLAGLQKLRVLELVGGGAITDLGPLANLDQLEVLTLIGQRPADLAPIAGLSNLRVLKLRANSLAAIDSIAELTELEELDLSHNYYISDIDAIAQMTKLRRLDLSQNEIADIDALAGLTSLEHLELRANFVADLSPLSNLTSLRYLGLYKNLVSDIEPVSALPELVDIYLVGSPLVDVTPIRNLPRIHTLTLSENAISDLGGLLNAGWETPMGCADIHLDGNSLSDETLLVDYPEVCASNPNVAIWVYEGQPCNPSATCWFCLPGDCP